MQNTIIRLPTVIAHTGLSRSTIYLRIKQGSFPAPVSLGARAVGWPSTDIDALNNARIAGKSENEVRALVIDLEKERKSRAKKNSCEIVL